MVRSLFSQMPSHVSFHLSENKHAFAVKGMVKEEKDVCLHEETNGDARGGHLEENAKLSQETSQTSLGNQMLLL